MTARERLTLAAAVAVLLAATALRPVYAGSGWLLPVAGAVAAVAAAGALARRGGVPPLLQPLLTLLALAAYVVLLYTGPTLHLLLVPGHDTVQALRTLVEQGMKDTRELAPPVPTSRGLVLLAVLGVGGTAVLVDTVAVVLDRAAVAGLPLLLLFAVPSAVLPAGLGWLPFTFGAAGWLLLLLVEGGERVRRWGAPLAGPLLGPRQHDPGAVQDAALGRAGRRIGAAALGVALVVPAVLPGLDAGLLAGRGSGDGGSGTGRASTTYNPITTLRGQLTLPTPRVLLSYTTTEKVPDYLRLTTLDRFDGRGWSSSRLNGDPDADAVQGGVPVPEGVDLERSLRVRERLRIAQLDTQWLPVPATPTLVAVDGPWAWDARAETVFSTAGTTHGLRAPYDVTAVRSVPAPGSLTTVGQVPDQIAPYTAPVALTPYVQSEVQRVTRGAHTDFERVEALQDYFLDGTRFTYSTSAEAKAFGTDDALETFLRDGKGFCEQFASAMAAMVRSFGLPARVAVGFTAGTPQFGAYVVTTSEAHAWPEVWFAGAGWVRFEPTPRSDGATTVPAYAVPPDAALRGDGADGGGASAAPSQEAGRAAGRNLDKDPRLADRGLTTPIALPAVAPSGRPVRRLAALMMLLLLAAPAGLGVLRRRQRRASLDAHTAWLQLQEDAEDVGHRWAPADSPRAAARGLLRARPLSGDAPAALGRLATAVEHARFARPADRDAPSGVTLADDVAAVRRALLAGVSAGTRWQARLLPRSTLRALSRSVGGATADLLDRLDALLAAPRRRRDRALGDRPGVDVREIDATPMPPRVPVP